MMYRVIRDDGGCVSAPVGTVLHYMPDHQHHAEAEARFNNRLFGLELDLVAVSFDGRGWFTIHRSALEPIEQGRE